MSSSVLSEQSKVLGATLQCTVLVIDLKHNWQLLWWLLLVGAMLKPQLKGCQLLIEERAGLELQLLILQQAATIAHTNPVRCAHGLRMKDGGQRVIHISASLLPCKAAKLDAVYCAELKTVKGWTSKR